MVPERESDPCFHFRALRPPDYLDRVGLESAYPIARATVPEARSRGWDASRTPDPLDKLRAGFRLRRPKTGRLRSG